MILRPASLEDASALATLGRLTFRAAFEHLYRPADLATFLNEAYSTEGVAAEIRAPEYLHRLAVEEGDLVGFCKMRRPSPYIHHSAATRPIALNQLYIAPDRIGQSIGAALMDWAVAEARAGGHDAIQLSVWSENDGAQRFYKRYGFAHIADIDFWVGTHRDDEFLFELRLD